MNDLTSNGDALIDVFLVDDHPIVCGGLKSVIERQRDMRVLGEAYDGIDAQEAVVGLKPHVVIMDLMLPRQSGIQTTQQIKRACPEIKVLVLTGLSELDSVRQVLESGASGVMLKQITATELVSAIRRVAAGEQYLDPELVARMERSNNCRSHVSSKPALSEREATVLRLLAAGHTAKEMSAQLSISARTLETYRARGMEKLSLKNRADIVRYAALQGWLSSAR